MARLKNRVKTMLDIGPIFTAAKCLNHVVPSHGFVPCILCAAIQKWRLPAPGNTLSASALERHYILITLWRRESQAVAGFDFFSIAVLSEEWQSLAQ
jgi:hypothetical protein